MNRLIVYKDHVLAIFNEGSSIEASIQLKTPQHVNTMISIMHNTTMDMKFLALYDAMLNPMKATSDERIINLVNYITAHPNIKLEMITSFKRKKQVRYDIRSIYALDQIYRH